MDSEVPIFATASPREKPRALPHHSNHWNDKLKFAVHEQLGGKRPFTGVGGMLGVAQRAVLGEKSCIVCTAFYEIWVWLLVNIVNFINDLLIK